MLIFKFHPPCSSLEIPLVKSLDVHELFLSVGGGGDRVHLSSADQGVGLTRPKKGNLTVPEKKVFRDKIVSPPGNLTFNTLELRMRHSTLKLNTAPHGPHTNSPLLQRTCKQRSWARYRPLH